MSSSLSSCTNFCSSTPLVEKQEMGIFGEKGSGSSLIGKVTSLSNTFIQKLNAFSYQPVYKSLHSIILETPGQNLTRQTFHDFFRCIAKERTDLQLIETFYRMSTISDSNVDELKKELLDKLKKEDKNGPICIPIAMGRNSVLEPLHIAIIQIIDNNVYYYDSQGLSSRLRPLKDGQTIRDLIEMCQQVLTDGKGKIIEDSPIHQWDIINCGAYACHYVFQTMIMGKTHEELIKSDLPLSYIQKFRNAMADDFDKK